MEIVERISAILGDTASIVAAIAAVILLTKNSRD